jgi:uncharacterized membrane protein
VGAAWLLFLPNAFYIVSDFVHLGKIEGMSVWYDAVLIGAFACVGLVFGFASLRIMESLVRGLGPAASRLLALGSIALSAVGIYLGRVLKFNSWDVIVRPGRLAASLLTPLTDPADHLRGLAMTTAIAIGFALAYLALRWFFGRRDRFRARRSRSSVPVA